MGHFSVVHGYIFGILEHAPHNAQVIAGLPDVDSSPRLTRDLFSVPNNHYSYNGQVISFGEVYNGVECCWEVWLTKFENLLRNLYWDEAQVHLETELWGTYHYTWEPKFMGALPDLPSRDLAEPWTFSGGPRSGIRELWQAQHQSG